MVGLTDLTQSSSHHMQLSYDIATGRRVLRAEGYK